VELAIFHVPAVGKRRAVLLTAHAMMANSRYFRGSGGFAHHLASRGIDVFMVDFRGHGASVPPDPRTGRWLFDDYVELDFPAALSAVAAAAAIAPQDVVFVGHSLGGLVGVAAYATGMAPPAARISLWATCVWRPGPKGSIVRRAMMNIYSLSSMPLGYAPIRMLRVGTDDEPSSYVRQLASWARNGRWTSRTGNDYNAALRGLTSIVWPVTGSRDRLCMPRDAEGFVELLPNALPVRIVGPAHGDAVEPDHFALFKRAELTSLWDELAAFAVNGSPDR
jgi:predicted alpha/beta hydrolase